MAGVVLIGLIALVLVVGGAVAWQSTYGGSPSGQAPKHHEGWQGDYSGGFWMEGLLPWQTDRADQLTQSWAREHNYRIISSEYRWFDGPFFWNASRNQVVRHITVRDQYGRERSGHIRLGSWFSGIWSAEVAVAWDEPAQTDRWRRP